MKIAVCVKHVPEGPSHLDAQTKRLDRSGEGALNHFDANAVEEALRLKGDSDTEVVAVSIGPQKALTCCCLRLITSSAARSTNAATCESGREEII